VTDMLGAGERTREGLRERKKARTRASIREHALRLFREQTYQGTTVEQIAAAAEVSPSTFFRYFPTKEDVVLRDDFDTRLFEAFERQPPGLRPISAIRAAVKDALATLTPKEWAEFRESADLSFSVPEIRSRAFDELAQTIQSMADMLAKRVGRAPDDLAVRVIAGAVLGVIITVTMPWTDLAQDNGGADAFRRVDEALALLEAGLPL
jgi:AcrR family transcriptional regulator